MRLGYRRRKTAPSGSPFPTAQINRLKAGSKAPVTGGIQADTGWRLSRDAVKGWGQREQAAQRPREGNADACRRQAGPLMEPARGVLPAPGSTAMGTGAQFSAFSGEVYVLIFYVVSPNIYSWQLMQTL